MEFNRIPDEYNRLPEEDHLVPEIASPAPECPPMSPEITTIPEEFSVLPEAADQKADRSQSRNVLKKLFRSLQMPVAAALATTAVFLAASGADPLGNDFLASGNDDPIAVALSTPTPTPTVEPAPTETPTPTPTPAYLNYPEGSVTDATEKVLTVIHASNEPDYIFESSPCETEQEAMAEVKAWLKTWGGNPNFLPETSRTRKFLGYQLSDDAIIAGSGDSPQSMVLLGGSIYAVYQVDIYCDAYLRSHAEGYYEFGDSTLPLLPNLNPDFAGDMAWNEEGLPEQYVRMVMEGDTAYRYLEMGEVWEKYYRGQLADVPGATYDPSSNTLTLENCTAEVLDINLMGNGFTVNLIGENRLGCITAWGAMYGGSITFSGNGSLIVNESRANAVGLLLNAEGSQSAVICKGGVEIEIYGAEKAIEVVESLLDNPICFLADHTLLAGGVRNVTEDTAPDGSTVYTATVVIPDGTPATFAGFESLD